MKEVHIPNRTDINNNIVMKNRTSEVICAVFYFLYKKYLLILDFNERKLLLAISMF